MPDVVEKKSATTTEVMGVAMGDVQRGLAWFISISFVLLIFVWVFRPPTMAPESMAQLNQLVSTLQNIMMIAIGFFFGSSKSSQNKDDAIMTAALEPTPSAPTPAKTTTVTEPEKTTTTTEPAVTVTPVPEVKP